MRRLPLAQLLVVGMPPRADSQGPLGFIDGFVLIVALALLFWLSVRFVMWVEARVELWELLEIRRDYQRNRPPPGQSGNH